MTDPIPLHVIHSFTCPLCQSSWTGTVTVTQGFHKQCDFCLSSFEHDGDSSYSFRRYLESGAEHSVSWNWFKHEPSHQWILFHPDASGCFRLPNGLPFDLPEDQLIVIATGALFREMDRYASGGLMASK